MNQTPEKRVLLFGTSASTQERLRGILTMPGVEIQTWASLDSSFESKDRDDCALFLVEIGDDNRREVHAVAKLKQMHPFIPVLALIDGGNIPLAVRAIQAGADDCIEKPAEALETLAAVEDLLERTERPTRPVPCGLTPSEMTVLRHLLEGKTSRQIAHALCRSPRTIEVHRSHIMHKLGVSTTVDLIKAASAMGLLAGSCSEASRFENV